MLRATLLTVIVLGIGYGSPRWAAAQYGGYRGYSSSPNGPTVSPYLNLLQNNSGVPNYQTLVRPQFEARNAIVQQQQSLQQLQDEFQSRRRPSRGGLGSGTNSRSTGHPTHFSEYSHYYNPNLLQRSVSPYAGSLPRR